jgi:hypothetical protein
MGAPTLKIKKNIHYRKRTAKDGGTCRSCRNFIEMQLIRGIGGRPLRYESRCKAIGIGDGRAYKVDANHTCDYWEVMK